jgi:hypothetical protein
MAVDQDCKNKIDYTSTFLSVQAEKRPIKRGAQSAPLVCVHVGIRESRQKRLRLVRQILCGYSGSLHGLVVFERPVDGECTSPQATILCCLDCVIPFLGKSGELVHGGEACSVAVFKVLEDTLGAIL